MFEQKNQLFMELSSLEDRGVTIWLEGNPSFEEGRLKEVHFDKVVTPDD